MTHRRGEIADFLISVAIACVLAATILKLIRRPRRGPQNQIMANVLAELLKLSASETLAEAPDQAVNVAIGYIYAGESERGNELAERAWAERPPRGES